MERRNTIQRELILEAVATLGCHATADEIYAHICKTHPGIARGTVYRNLNILAEDGTIRKVEFPGDPARFDHLKHKHHHVQCVKCKAIFDVELIEAVDLSDKIKMDQDVELLEYDILFKGICQACKEKAAKEEENE